MRRLILLSLLALAAARYVDVGREKRDIEYHEWLTEAQKSELKQLKESADGAALKKRTMELYDLLPADEKAKWNAKYKEMCVAWVKEVATEEETANYKKWKAEGKMEEITGQYKKLKERLSEEKRKDVELWEDDCWNLWKDEFPASRGRRSIMDLAKDKLGFLGDDKLAELKALKESGASDDVIRDKVVTWTLEHWKSTDKNLSTGDFVKKCYGWIKDVTQEEEYAAFEKLHHTDHEACRVKVREFLARLPADKQAAIEKSLPLCDAIWYKQHQEEHGAHTGHGDHDHTAHKHHGKRHLNTMHIDKFMTWLSPEQKAEIHNLEKGGESYEKLLARMKEMYTALESEKKEEVRELIKDKCAEWVYAKTNEEEQAEMHEFIRMADKEGLIEFLKKPYGKLSEEEKHEVDHTKEMCLAIWTTAPDRKRRDHHHHEEYKDYFNWLSDEQQAEVKVLRDAGKHEEVYTKTMEFYDGLSGDKKNEATEKLKGACRHFFKGAFGEAAVEEVKQMKESGSSMDEIGKKVEEFIGKITDEKKKAIATKASANCKKVFSASRRRRDHHNPEEYKEYFSWLTPEQGAELKALRDADKHDEAYAKTLEFHAALDGDKKTEATEKMKGACKHFFKGAFGDAAVEEVKQMKESGSSMDDIGKKVEEFISKITDEKKKAAATRVSVNCKKIFSASRRRRDHHNPEEYKEYFSWLTPEQGAELKALRDADKHDEAYAKTLEFHAALEGEKKTEATEKMKGACKHFFKGAFGDAAVEEVKQMKESGSSMDDIGKKVEELISKITDDKKKAAATRVSANCKKIFSASRRRRDHHNPEEYKEYFSWLTPEQGAELKALRDADKHDEAYAKTLEFHAALEGDKKTEATEKMKGACKHFFKGAFGDAAVEEVKQMKESGSSMDDIGKKVEELISKITDEKKKAAATRVSANCKKIFSASRKRRSDPSEEYKEYFSWLTPEQGAEWKAARDAGDEEGAYKKVEAIYDALEGEKKAEATQKLKGACKHFFNKEFGPSNVEELKQLKEGGASMEKINEKVEEFLGQITDEKKKAKATRIAANCKKVFGSSRRRRDEHKHTVDEAMTEFLPWLTDAQKAEIKGLKEAGKEDQIGEKILEFFDTVDASKKDEARTKLQAGCRHYLKHLIGDAASEEMKALKETGATDVDMAARLEEIIGKIADGEDKKKAVGMSKNCKKVYGVASRKRRHEHTLDEGLTEFLPWLTDAQKAELKQLKESGGQDKIGEKVLEFFEAVDASKKDEARTKLQAGCKHYIKFLIGDSAAAEMKALADAGTSPADMAVKLEAVIGAMADGEAKTKAERLSKQCKRVFGVVSRRRRHEHTLEEGFTEFLPWLTEEQKMELKNMKEAGASDKMGEKILEYFDNVDASKKDEARSKLQAGCRHYIKHLIGDAAAAEMKALHEAGTTPANMAVKLEEIIGKMADGEDKTKAERMSKNCKKVYGVVSRKRRHEHTLEEGFTEFLPWITEEQKMELKNMKESGAADKIGDKVIEYYESVDASKKDEARTKLQAGCRHYLKHLLGDAVAGEMKSMHESGSSPADMAKKLDEIIEKMDDETKKAKAAGLSKNCRKVYGVDARKRRNTYGEYDERYHQYYNWLEDDQKEELAELKDSGEDDALLDKVSQYFKDLSDAKKEEARGQLKMGCRMRMRDLLGEDKAEEIRRMKDEGASKGEMMDKVAQFVEEMEEGGEKESARRSYKHCAKILGRQRRDNKDEGTLGDYTKWLTAEQRQELNAIIRSETISSDDIYSKLFEFLEQLEGQEKREATFQMKGACRLFRSQFLGKDQSNKLTMMRETGKRWHEIEQTLDAMIAAIEDASKRRKAQAAMNACKSLYKTLFDQ